LHLARAVIAKRPIPIIGNIDGFAIAGTEIEEVVVVVIPLIIEVAKEIT
jgi:hypothetical protein